VKPLVPLVILLVATTAATGRPFFSGGDTAREAQTAGSPHPAVVRILVPDGTTTSLGSGTLVAVTENLGLVVTNWHVVQDTRGQIVVAFPDGFRSGATLLDTDRDWDLAALAIQRPRAAPIPIATQPPQPGEPLTIAGYGSGQYRAVTGRCTQYVSPGRNHPFEMVELSAAARQGDSGGPILNSRGELAGVLFGAAWGTTAGSYSGRVRWFLNSVAADFQRLDASSTMIARQTAPSTPSVASQPQPNPTTIAASPPSPGQGAIATGVEPNAWRPADREPSSRMPVVAIPALPPSAGSGRSTLPATPSHSGWTAAPVPFAPSITIPIPDFTEPLRWEDVAGSTRSEQFKTILAAIGLLAILFHAMRLLGNAPAAK